ncbi:MAG: phage portal protein [Veillonellales bacterium]
MKNARAPNLLDRAIAYVSPVAALKRERARLQLAFTNSGYSQHGASYTKKSLQGWRDHSSSPDEDITWNLPTLRNRCRSLYMGVPVATGALKTARTNVIGPGLRLKSSIDANMLQMSDEQADQWESTVEKEWALFADSKECDAARTCDFNQLQRLAFLSALMSGDIFILLPVVKRKNVVYDLKVQLVEADRVCNPDTQPEIGNFQAGIEVDDFGAPIRYHIAKYYPSSLLQQGMNTWTAVDAFGARTGRRNVLHLMDLERPGQRRGVPFLASVIEAFKQLGRYTDAELMAAVISGFFTVAITTDGPNMELGELDSTEYLNQDIPVGGTVTEPPLNDPGVALGNGKVVQLAPGEKVESINPGRPNSQFDPFVTAVLRQIGAALEIPMELLIKHFTASYSASRAALLEAWKLFKTQRAWMVSAFCQPIYEEWLTEAVVKGRINAPGFFSHPAIRRAYCGAEWNGPAPGQIDPKKEVEASVIKINNCISTRAKETAELTGGDFNANCRQRIKEEKMMREGGLIPTTQITETIQENGGGTDGKILEN